MRINHLSRLILIGAFALAGSAVAAKTVDVSSADSYPKLYRPSEPGSRTGAPDVVLLGADLVEIAVALGAADRILARPADIDLPGIEATPHKIREWAGVEGVAALRPGLVIGSAVINKRLLDGLARLGVKTDLVDRTLPAVEKVRRIAALLGLEERGAKLVAAIERDYRAIAPVTVDGRPLRLLHASKMGAGTSFSAGGAETAVHNLIRRVGALNAAAEIGRDRYRTMTPEGMVVAAPDVILISEKEIPSFGGPEGIWTSYPGVALTPAGRNRKLIVMRELHVRSDAASSGIATRALHDALRELFP